MAKRCRRATRQRALVCERGQNSYPYAPYGTQVAKTGTRADPKFLWNGGSGYRNTGRSYADLYVRARHYGITTAQWTTSDPSKIGSIEYKYAEASPASLRDPTGYLAIKRIKGPACGAELDDPSIDIGVTQCTGFQLDLPFPPPFSLFAVHLEIQNCVQCYDNSGCGGTRRPCGKVADKCVINSVGGGVSFSPPLKLVEELKYLDATLLVNALGNVAQSILGFSELGINGGCPPVKIPRCVGVGDDIGVNLCLNICLAFVNIALCVNSDWRVTLAVQDGLCGFPSANFEVGALRTECK